MITEFKTIPKAVYYVQTAAGCTVLDPDGDPLAEITAPGGYFPGIAAADGGPGTVTFSGPVKRVVGPFDMAPQLQLTLLGLLGGNDGLPAGYKRVAYLEGTGTQYCKIPTEVGSELFRAETDVLFTAERNIRVMGFSTFARYYWGVNERNNYTLGGTIEIPNISPNVRRLVTYENVNDTSWLETGGEIVSRTSTDRLHSRTEYGVWWPAEIHTEVDFCVAKIFSLKLFKANLLLAELLPALDPAGAPCLFDSVSRKPFYNQGTGDFLYPGKETDVSTYSLRRPITYAQLTEYGVRRLYKVPRGYNGTKEEYAADHGFKPLVETPQPEEGYWVPQWRETAEEIVLDWVETDPPEEIETLNQQ